MSQNGFFLIIAAKPFDSILTIILNPEQAMMKIEKVDSVHTAAICKPTKKSKNPYWYTRIKKDGDKDTKIRSKTRIGLRIGELAALKFSDVDKERRKRPGAISTTSKWKKKRISGFGMH